VSSVSVADAWPSMRWTAFTLAPAETARLAAVWRRSGVTPESPAASPHRRPEVREEQDQRAVLLAHLGERMLGSRIGKIKCLLAGQEALLGLRPRQLHPRGWVAGDAAVSYGTIGDPESKEESGGFTPFASTDPPGSRLSNRVAASDRSR